MPATNAAEASDERLKRALKAFDDALPDEELIVEAVPGVAHPINRGLDGASNLLRGRSTGRTFFLKVLSPQTSSEACFKDICKIAQSAHASGIAPKLISADDAESALLFDGLTEEWTFGTVRAFRNREVRFNAVDCLKQLHEIDALSTRVSVFDRIGRLKGRLNDLASTMPDSAGRIVPELYHTMCDWTSRIIMAIDASGHDDAPCKVENSLSNFMISPSGHIRLVDFDRATMTDPFFDIGVLCNEFCRTDEDIAEIVEAYRGSIHTAELARVKLYMIASAFHLGLWGIVSQYRAPKTQIEFFKYGQNQFLRCRSALARWDVGHLVRKV